MFLSVLGQASSAQARSEGIIAVVNDGIISRSDLNDRVRLVLSSSGLPDNEAVRGKVSAQVLRALIEEEIKNQEAVRLEIEVTEEDIDRGFAAIAAQNDMAPERFREVLARSGINTSTMEAQIRAQIAWTKIVQSQIRPKIVVTDADIDQDLERLARHKGQPEYLVSSIALPVDEPEQEEKMRKLSEQILSEMAGGKAPFFKVAQQFSKAPGAAQGGTLGWIRPGQLSPALDDVLKTMEKNTISKPIRAIDGYHILFLRDVRVLTDETIPARDEIKNAIGMRRLERLQRLYYTDLKAAAFIDLRV